MSENSSKISFKSLKRKKPLRKRGDSDGEDSGQEPEDTSTDILEETLELQKLRKRAHGVNVMTLALGKKISRVDEMVNNDPDPFKLKSGGLLSLDGAKKAAAILSTEDGAEDEAEKIVGTVFSKETRIRDEDEEMQKFIESELVKRRGKNDDNDHAEAGPAYLSPEDRALLSLPEHLKKATTKKSEEMLSSQMLSGIPEVDLGVEEKIRNIEATEMAKKKAAEERNKLKVRPSEFVPTNLAVNFKQPNRFKTDDDLIKVEETKKPKVVEKLVTQRTVVVGQMPAERVINLGKSDGSIHENDPVRATDDVHVQKFKKHFQRK